MAKKIEDFLPFYLGCDIYITHPNAAFRKDILDAELLCRLLSNELPVEYYKLLLRRLYDVRVNDLILFIKNISLIDLSDCEFECEASTKNEYYVNAISNGVVIDSLSFDGYGCNHGNSGCHECGYTGKIKQVFPIYAFMPDGRTLIIIKNQQL